MTRLDTVSNKYIGEEGTWARSSKDRLVKIVSIEEAMGSRP